MGRARAETAREKRMVALKYMVVVRKEGRLIILSQKRRNDWMKMNFSSTAVKRKNIWDGG